MDLLALIFVPPLTDFSKDPDMADEHVAMSSAGRGSLQRVLVLKAELEGFGAFHGSYCAGLNNVVMVFSQWSCAFAEPEYYPQ